MALPLMISVITGMIGQKKVDAGRIPRVFGLKEFSGLSTLKDLCNQQLKMLKCIQVLIHK
jgi:hypothetical protein